VLAPNQWGEALAMQRFETTFGPTLTFYPLGGAGLGEAFEAYRAEIGQLE
jgi:hypothetical protein